MSNMHGERVKGTIIQTALALWREGGERAVSARAIGKKMGLTHAGVIYHFNGIAGLMDAVKREAIASGDTKIIPQLIVAGDPLVAGWSAADRQTWLGLAG